MSTLVYDLTAIFVNNYVDKRSRTFDQMVQAARSSKQNIAEGCSERTSKSSELKLLGIARASLKELLEDYEDYLRQRGLEQWNKVDPEALKVRKLSYMTYKTYRTYTTYMAEPGRAANCLVCLICQTGYLLDKQINRAEEEFARHGGYRENLLRKRLSQREGVDGMVPPERKHV